MESSSPNELVAEVICIGETMVMLGADEGSLRTSEIARIYVAGAESNVARGLAHLGRSAEWFGRVGDDPFGARVIDTLDDRGVDVSRVIVTPGYRTGLYVKEWGHSARHPAERSRVFYYRAGSASTQLSPDDLAAIDLDKRVLCHISGITPALSPSCDRLIEAILDIPRDKRPIVSFDVNYRPALWPIEQAGPRLLELARRADIVIVGRDEAETLWGTATDQDVRNLLDGVPTLVVKDDAIGASCYRGDERVFVPALRAEVIEPIGAGDAFAAGYLTGWLERMPVAERLKLGHVMAAHTLQHIGDNPVLPPARELREMAASDDETWTSIHLPHPESATPRAAISEESLA